MPIPKQLTATRPYLCIFKKKNIFKNILVRTWYGVSSKLLHILMVVLMVIFFRGLRIPSHESNRDICENHVQGPDPPVEALGTTDLYGSKWGYQPSMGSLTYTCYRLL